MSESNAGSPELTLQEAAHRLNLAVPELVRLLEDGILPYRKVDGLRLVRADDVFALQAEDGARRVATRELTREAQALGLDY